MKIKNVMKKMRTAFLISMIVFVSAGCGGNQANTQQQLTGTLKIWKPFMDSEEWRSLVTDFQAKNPQVKIDYVKKNIENYEADLLDALASGSGPDIFTINNSWLPKYQDKIAPAPDTVFKYLDYKNTFLDVMEEDFTKDSKVYGTAFSIDTLGLYYNKDILGSNGYATPPKTLDELSKMARAATRQDSRGYFTVSGLAAGTSANVNRASDMLYLFMLQQGAKAWNSDFSRPTFSQPVQKNGKQIFPGALGLGFYTSFANPQSPNYMWNTQSDYSVDAFANGRAAFLYGYSFTRQTIRQKSPNLNFDVAAVPQVNLDDPRINFASYFGEVVSKQSKNSELAWKFLKFMTSKENLDKYYKKHKLPASRKDLVEAQVQDPDIGVFASSGLTAKQFYRPDQQKMDAIMLKAIDNVTLSGMRVDQAVSQAEQQVSTLGRGVY